MKCSIHKGHLIQKKTSPSPISCWSKRRSNCRGPSKIYFRYTPMFFRIGLESDLYIHMYTISHNLKEAFVWLFHQCSRGEVVSSFLERNDQRIWVYLDESQELFDQRPFQNVLSWNSLLALCDRCEDVEGRIPIFNEKEAERGKWQLEIILLFTWLKALLFSRDRVWPKQWCFS